MPTARTRLVAWLARVLKRGYTPQKVLQLRARGLCHIQATAGVALGPSLSKADGEPAI